MIDYSDIKEPDGYVESIWGGNEGKIWKDCESFVESTGTKVGESHVWKGREYGDSVSKGSVGVFEYLQMMGSTYSPTYCGDGKSFLGTSLNEFNVHELNSSDDIKIRGLKADYIVFDDYQYPTFYGDSVAAPEGFDFSKLTVYENPFPYLEMCGT